MLPGPCSPCPHRVEGSLTGTLICSPGVRSHILSTCEGPHHTGVAFNGGFWGGGAQQTPARFTPVPRRVTGCGEEWAVGTLMVSF